MATLIKSKQIQGIVTASVVTGEFLVSGSLVVTGSNSILGSVTASAISSSFIGDGSGITGLSYSQISGTPNFVGGGDVTVTESGGTVTISLTDDTGTDTQALSISGDQLSISGGNTITIPSGSGVSDYSLLTNIPQGIVSGSIQILGGSGVLSGSKTDISSINTFTSSIQTQVDGISAVTSSFLTDSGSVSYTDITDKPTLISSSNQITITESQISDLDKYNDSDVKTKLDADGVISGSIVEQLPEGVISGSTQITITQSQISDLAHTDVANLNTFTSSIQSEVDSLTSVTSSYLTTVPDGTISGSSQVIESLPSGVISGSTQISITESQISDLDKYTDSDVQSYVDSIGVVSGSVIAELPSGVISGSEQLPSGIISGSTQLVSSLPSGIISGSEQLPSGLISGSTQITITESQISDLTHTEIPDGTISGSAQVIDSLPDGVVSGSSQITISESQISDLDKYTDSDVKTKLDAEGVVSGSVIRTIPQGTISGSEQLPSGLVSGSSQITITESQISDLSHTDISSLNTFTSSIQTEVDVISAATSSYLTSSGSVDFSDITSLPGGLVSGSTQITDGSGIVSSSTQVIEHLPSGTVSGSTQITDGSGLLSSSAQIASDISSSYTELSQSLDSRVDILENFSGSTYTAASESIDTRLDALEGSVGFYYDLSNTVWNNKYIKSGSGMASNTSNFQTGNVPFKFRLNTDRKLQYGLDDVVYLSNFDRDTTITAIVSSSYETGSREVGLTVISVNQETGSVRINDSYWVISRHSAGFVDSASYIEASASFDHRIDIIVSSGSGADWNVNLTNIPQGIISSSKQQYTASIENGFALTSSVDSISASLATTIENVFQSSSNFDNKGLFSGSSQVDLRNVTNYVSDEHIDHSTITLSAGLGLDGGGDISDSREFRLNVTSSHFEEGVKDVLTSEGVVKTSTLNTDLISTDFSQSVDSRINNIVASSIPAGTVSSSQQITNIITDEYISASAALSGFGGGGGTSDFTQLTNVPNGLVSGSIQILGGSGIISGSQVSQRLTSLESFTGSLDAEFATDVELGNLSSSLSASIADAAQSGGGDGILSGSEQIASDISGSFTSLSESLDTRITTEKDRIDNILSGANADYDQFVEIVDLVNSTDTENDTAFANHYTSSRQRLTSLESFTGSLDTDFVSEIELTTFSQSVSASIYNAAQSGSGVSSWNELSDIPTGIISSSIQIASDISGSTNELSSSLSASIYQASLSGSGVSSWNELSDIPSGVISGSEQLPSGLFSGSLVAGTNVTINQEGDDFYITASLAGGSVPSGTVSSSAQITYDGNRTISNDKLGDLFTDSVNPGTSGSVIDFLNAVFYPNSAPSISTGNQTIIEYVTSGTTITTVSGTDPEGQALTFGTASAYTDDLVRVASNGVMTLNALAESSSFNTDLVGGVHGHKVEVTATDTFGTTAEKDIYVIVTPNSTPVFRETSTSGNVITSVTANLNESSTNNTLVKRVYFSDANGDDITIYSSSIDNNHFDVTKYSTYVDIRQNTGSLDYEQQTSYTFSISASDEHYESGQDSDSIVGLPITVNVTDNLTPTVNNQTLSSINENSSNGATVGSISAADNEGNTITFVNFELHQLQLDNSIVSSGSYSGTSQLTDPHENPFQMSTSGIVTRKTGVYLNSDLINEYIYRVQVTDPYNGSSDVALITINITDDTPATLSDNWSAGPYIKESELSGTTIKTTDYGSNAADYGSNQSGTWSSSKSGISINTNGTLSLGVNLSGSVTQSGDTIDSTITFTNTFGTTTTDSLTLDVVGNDAPTATFTNQTSVFNSNQATNGTNLVSVSISDTESDSPYELTLGNEDAGKLNAVPQNAASSSWELQASEDLIGGTYTYDVTITDSYSETTTYSSRTITIAQGDNGTLGGDTTSYIIESAENGDAFRDASGFGAGNASQLSVSYTNYGSPSVQSFTSSNSSVAIDSSGYITFNGNLSGTGSGETITSDITFDDQYGNVGSGSVTVNVFANGAPTATFSNSGLTGNYNENLATSGTNLVDVSITDTEGDTPYSMSLSGTGAWAISAVPQNSDSSSYEIQVTYDTSSLVAGTFDYDVEVTDSFGKTTNYNGRSFTIAASDDGTLVSTDTYIIESAETGDYIRRNTDGRSGTQSSVAVSYSPSHGSPVATNFASSNALIDIDSNGKLSVGNDISGSGNTNGNIIATTITWNDQYSNNGSQVISIDVTKNFAPTVNSTQTFNTNTNQATGSENIVRLNLTDTESDTISAGGLTWSGYNTSYFTPSNSTGQMNLLVNSTSVPAGNYPYTASIKDVHGFDTTVHSGSVTISQADNGTLGGDTAIYSIESAESGDSYRDATGYNNGNTAQLSVSYSPSYGSPSVQTFSSSNPAIVVDNSGNLTLGVDISGSVTQSGDTISSTITFTDEYGNSDTGTVTATIFGNQSPAASFVSSSNYDTDGAISGSTAGTLTVTDVESNSPFTISLGGTHGTSFDVSGTSSPFTIQPVSDLSAGTYTIDITVTDSYSETVTLSSETIIVDTALVTGLAYVYSTGQRSGTLLYDIGASAGSGTPPTLSSYSGNGFIEKIEDGDLGSTSFTYSWGGTKTATLLASGSGANLDTILQGFGDITKTDSNTFVIIAPKDTDMTGVPTSMRNGYSGTATGEYVLEIAVDGDDFGAGLGTVEDSTVYDFNLGSAVGGTTNYHLIVPNNTIAPASSIALAVVPSSGSTP